MPMCVLTYIPTVDVRATHLDCITFASVNYAMFLCFSIKPQRINCLFWMVAFE